MQLPENPIARAFAVLFAFVLGLGALGYLLVLLLLIAVSLENPHRRELTVPTGLADTSSAAQYQTTDLYLRNRTAAPLQVRVAVPRAEVQFDSIWWPLPNIPDAIGRAVMLREGLAVGGLRYRAGRTLVLGSVDTLIDVHYPSPLPRALAHCRRIDIRYSPELAHNRAKNGDPNYERVARVQRLPARAKSLLLTLYLAPGDTLALGHRTVGTGPVDWAPRAEPPGNAAPPAIVVQWQDAQGHRHEHRPRLADWGAAAPPVGSQRVQHYLDYPLTYTTVIAQ
jgi:hypothetical protein